MSKDQSKEVWEMGIPERDLRTESLVGAWGNTYSYRTAIRPISITSFNYTTMINFVRFEERSETSSSVLNSSSIEKI
jgi:hypothetical protein